MTNFPPFVAPSAEPYAPTYNSNRTAPMGDMIDRDAALEPVTQPAPDAAFASGFKAGLKAAAEHWFRGVSGVRQLLPETKAQILAIPCPQPAPDALLRCAECSCDDGNCTWIATDDDIYPYDAIEQCERDLDGVEDTPDPAAMTPEVAKLVEAAWQMLIEYDEANIEPEPRSMTSAAIRLRAALAALRAGGIA